MYRNNQTLTVTEKSFYKGTKRYLFKYEALTAPIAPSQDTTNAQNEVHASSWTFEDEEDVRVKYYYPYIKKGDVVFDIGASFGSYTLPALALGARVFSFSPEREYETFNRSIKLNSITFADAGADWFTYPYGLYSDKGFFKTDTAVFSKEDKTEENNGKVTGWWIKVDTLDRFMTAAPTRRGIDKIDFIKIDAEGAEAEVLKGGLKTITRYKPKILIEVHLFKNAEMGDRLKEVLEPLGYKLKIMPRQPQVSHAFCFLG